MKLSRFTNIVRDTDYLLHNTLSNGLIRVKNENLKQMIDNFSSSGTFQLDPDNDFQQTLYSLNMIVHDNEDELATLHSSYFNFEHNSELSIILIVTRKCNFRCSYCYEEYSNNDMSLEVFNNTINYIISQIEERNFKNVYLSFFGGEPTLMANEINEFMEHLLEKNNNLPTPANIQAVITTNGYLLTPEMIDKFISNNIFRYQITVDGMEKDHDSSRYLAGKQGSWKTIIENLKYFKTINNKNVSVLIRSNITPSIYHNIDEWLEYLHNNFNEPIFRMHFETAKNFGKMNDFNFNLIENETETVLDIIERAKKWYLPLELVGFRTLPFSMVCYAARQFHYIVDYNGEIKKCTSASLDEPYNIMGALDSSGIKIDYKKAAKWTSYELSEKCKTCDILGLCYRRKCPVSKENFHNCNHLIETYYKGLEYYYLTNK